MEIVQYKTGSDPLVKVWRAMDKSEHFGIIQDNDKYAVVRGDGLPSKCSDRCPKNHLIIPEEYLGEYDEGWKAARRLSEYLEERFEFHNFQGKEPILTRGLRHPRGKKDFI